MGAIRSLLKHATGLASTAYTLDTLSRGIQLILTGNDQVWANSLAYKLSELFLQAGSPFLAKEVPGSLLGFAGLGMSFYLPYELPGIFAYLNQRIKPKYQIPGIDTQG